MDPTIEQLREQMQALVDENTTIRAAADAEKRDLTDEELETFKANNAQWKRLKDQADALEEANAQAAAMSAPQGRITAPDDMVDGEGNGDGEPAPQPNTTPRARAQGSGDDGNARPRARVVGQASRLSGTHGFRGFGDFVSAVRMGSVNPSNVDGRLLAAAVSTNASESVGADGGFLVPPDYRDTIMGKVFNEDSLIGRTDMQPVSGNSLTLPTDMTTPWGATGIQAYWTGEAAAISQSKPELQDVSIRLHKLAALVPVTEELLDDAPAMGAYVSNKAGEKIDWKLSQAVAYGTGAGQPLGFMNAPALVTQAAEGGQTTDTINAQNVVKMYSRMPVQNRRTAVWLIHPDAEPQLPLMTLGDQPIYLPPGGIRNDPYGSLMGRPVIPHQVCQTVGDLGDIMLVDLNAYLAAMKSGGLKAQTSIHLWFDQDITAFKFTMRVAGQPWWSEVTTAANGSHTMSPFVTLAAR